jgi:nucleoside phosphorylase
LKAAFPGDTPSIELKLLSGPMASNASVLADGTTVRRIVSQHRDALGVEMEAYGLMVAAAESGGSRPTAFSVKAIVDFADSSKDDRFRTYCAYSSAQVLRLLIEDLMMKQ